MLGEPWARQRGGRARVPAAYPARAPLVNTQPGRCQQDIGTNGQDFDSAHRSVHVAVAKSGSSHIKALIWARIRCHCLSAVAGRDGTSGATEDECQSRYE